MSGIKNFLELIRNKHNLLYKISLFIASVVLIVFFFPKEASFKYDFQKNKPWFYDDLLAPYDIPIEKTADEITKLTKETKKELYFDFLPNKAEEKIRFVEKEIALRSWQENDKPAILEKAKAIIAEVYRRGVIQKIAELDSYKDSAVFFVQRNRYYAEFTLADVYTPKTLSKYLLDKFGGKQRRLLVVLEKTFEIAPENILFNPKETEKNYNQKLNQLFQSKEIVVKGQSIIKRGDIVDQHKFQVLKSFERKHKELHLTQQIKWNIALGQTLLVSILIACLALYLIFFRRNLLKNNKNIVFLLLVVVGAVVATSIVLAQNFFSVYAMPLCLIPIITRSFFDSRTAFFVLLIVTLLLGFVVPNGLHFMFIQIVAGMVGLYVFVNFRNRTQLFVTSLIVMFAYCLSYFALNLVIEGDFTKINWLVFAWLGISAFLIVLAYPIIYLFEKLFGFVSDVTLLELADTNNKLLRELSRKAPGTFQHSLQVANLAEAAIHKIGGNGLLLRTAALYHDIGKMEAPMYFIENQSTGVNPHDELSYEESAQIIINHVIKGVEIAKKNNIPDLIVDFIRSHHGTTKTEYFYRKYIDENPDDLSVKGFQYPGPIPFSKESAILMMADSVEAASRSIKVPDVEKIDALVESIITHQLALNQFDNAAITLRDITLIKKIFKKMLMNIYHVRVEYPH